MFDLLLSAAKDHLTNCYTRDALMPLLGHLETEHHSNQSPFCVFILDVDYFKHFNDKHGHFGGDEVLKYFASSIRLDLESEANIPFRFGGDEFLVVFPRKTAQDVYRLAERLKKNIRTRNFLYKGEQLKMSFSGGIACYPEDGKTLDELMENADKALYVAKKKGARPDGEVRRHALRKNDSYDLVHRRRRRCFFGGYFFRGPIRTSVRGLANRVEISQTTDSIKKRLRSVKAKVLSPLIALVSAVKEPAPLTPPALKSTPASPPQASAASMKPVAPVPSAALDTIHLKSGRQITGMIVSETNEEYVVQLKLSSGKGTVKISKSDVLKVERGNPKTD